MIATIGAFLRSSLCNRRIINVVGFSWKRLAGILRLREYPRMQFNRFMWNLYRDSTRGREAMTRFAALSSEFVEADLRTIECAVSEKYQKDFARPTLSVDIAELVRSAAHAQKAAKNDSALKRFERLRESGIPIKTADKRGKLQLICTFGDDEDEWFDHVAAVSLGLHQALPELFLPYDFRCRFHQLEEIHHEFGIPLPQVPGKQQKDARANYYVDINAAWQEFRQLHQLSPIEMCAFLYDFAVQFVTPLDASDLPDPTKIWMITGGSWDIEFADSATSDSVSRWGANPGVRRGDILLLYLVRPRSCIHSIWRACTDGFVDPFFHYHTVAWISARIKIKELTLAELKAHPLLSLKPAVRAHFQGPNSKAPVTLEEYEAILKILLTKRQDVSKLPSLPIPSGLAVPYVSSERDVETELIEPFLGRLGYKERDWIRQMPVKMGRGERNYPDYAIGAVSKRGEENARMILESKYQLTAHRDFVDAFLQTKSYALRLQSQVMALGAREGIWVFPQYNGQFDIKHFVHKAWSGLSHPDQFHEILKLMGRNEVMERPKPR